MVLFLDKMKQLEKKKRKEVNNKAFEATVIRTYSACYSCAKYNKIGSFQVPKPRASFDNLYLRSLS